MTLTTQGSSDEYITLYPTKGIVYILSILAANEREEVVGRTRLLKMTFLLQEEIKKKHPEIHEEYGEYRFIPLWFGPASITFFYDLRMLTDLGLIEEIKEEIEVKGELKTRYTYKITDKGLKILKELTKEKYDILLNEAEKIKTAWNNKNLIELLRYVYNKYPELTKNSLIADLILY